MAYDGNQLKKISDEYGSQNKYNVKEYNDLANLGTEFLYGNSCGGALLEFLAENTGVEWELSQTNDRANPDRGIDYIGTSHLKDKTKVGLLYDYIFNTNPFGKELNIFRNAHNHPNGDIEASGYDGDKIYGDHKFANTISKLYPQILLYSYVKGIGYTMY